MSKAPSKNTQSHFWCFTFNNPGWTSGAGWIINRAQCRDFWYLLYKHEEAPETGTPHLQGYAIFKKRVRLSRLKTLFGTDKIHWTPCRGTVQHNEDYVRKLESTASSEDPGPFEWGSLSDARAAVGENELHQGKRNDLHVAAEHIRNGDLHLIDDAVAIKYGSHLLHFRASLFRDRDSKPDVVWLHGLTGTGKSRTAQDMFEGSKYWKPAGKWWDGYIQQDVVVIDDIRATDYPYQYLLRVLDRYPLLVEFKGGHVSVNSPTFVITAPGPPSEVYRDTTECLNQLERRISLILQLL